MFCFNTNLEWVIFVSSYNNWHSKACCWQGSILNLCYWSSVRLDSPETIEYAWNLSWDLELTSHLKQSEWKCLSKAQSFSTVFCPCLGTIGSLENWESKYWFLYILIIYLLASVTNWCMLLVVIFIAVNLVISLSKLNFNSTRLLSHTFKRCLTYV